MCLDGRKDADCRKERFSTIENKKLLNVETRKETSEIKRERSQSLDSKKGHSMSSFQKEISNYKSLTTNNPTTIILSKKLPSSSVQSVVSIPTESESSSLTNKTSPLRTSPRKVETKSPEEKSLASLVTRSAAYNKSSIQIKISPPRPNSADVIKKPMTQYPEKVSPKKDKLISEWFPKKDLNSSTSRRESAPLIIGLVPASSSGLNIRTKNPAITYEKSGN